MAEGQPGEFEPVYGGGCSDDQRVQIKDICQRENEALAAARRRLTPSSETERLIGALREVEEALRRQKRKVVLLVDEPPSAEDAYTLFGLRMLVAGATVCANRDRSLVRVPAVETAGGSAMPLLAGARGSGSREGL